MHRRARRRRPTESLEEFLPRFDEHGQHVPEAAELEVASRIDDLLDGKLLAEQAQAALGRLPDLYRAAFVLRDLEELDTSEVAELLGVDAATVRQRVHRARLMLRGYLSHLVGGQDVTPGLTCRDGVERLMDYLEGVLGASERAAIDAHVAGCPRCIAFVKSYVETPRIVRAATAAGAARRSVATALRRFLAARR